MTEQTPPSGPHAYAAAGVDLEAADKAITLMRGWVEKTSSPEVIGSLGGFAGLYDASALTRYSQPILATSTDGAGTKVAISQAMDVHDTIGFDLVGMVVDDLVVCGAEPLFMTDYIACGRVEPERIAAIVKGIAEACLEAGCALIGGETAEHPGLMEPDAYDVAGAATGVVEAAHLLGPGRVRPGDVVLAMASSGLHSNGYSLVRHVLLDQAGWALDRQVDELGRTLGEELLEPTRIYTKACLALAAETGVHAMAHITGGGLAGQPGAGHARGALGDHRPQHLGAGADLRRRTPGGCGVAGRPRVDPQLRRRHGRAPAGRRRRPGGRDPPPVRRARLGGGRGRARPGRWRRGPAHRSVRRLEPSDGPPDPCFGRFERRFERNVVHFGMGCAGTATHWVALPPRRNDRSDRCHGDFPLARPRVRGGRPYGARPS